MDSLNDFSLSQPDILELKTDFLKENNHLKEIQIESTNDDKIGEISCDDEVWLVQCPISINLEELNAQKLKLPGKSYHNNIETIATKYSEIDKAAFGCKVNNKFGIRLLPIEGSIMVREKLKLLKDEEIDKADGKCKKPTRVMLPEGLKERHPLHGADYKKISQIISKPIRERLENVVKLKKRIASTKCDKYDSNSRNDKIKKDKKKSDCELNSSHVKKPKYNEIVDDNLQWINNL